MLYLRTYLDKFTTIVKDSHLNTGFNPVSDVFYGRNLSRALVYFDHEKIKQMVNDKITPDITKFKHTLKITNAGSLDLSQLHKVYGSQIDQAEKKRAASFDLIFFLITKSWDNGKGFNYTKDYFIIDFYDETDYDIDRYISKDGATWYQPKNGLAWKTTQPFMRTNDDQVMFYIKSDKNYVSNNGDTVVFTYSCRLNEKFLYETLKFKASSQSYDLPVEIGEPIYFSKSGMPCHNKNDIRRFGEYAQVQVKFPYNSLGIEKKYSFYCEYTLNGKKYKSNPYVVQTLNPDNYQGMPIGDDGIYSTATFEEQLKRFENGESTVIVGVQHFDIGCENIELDITDTFNKFITGELDNNGIGIAFAPNFEYEESETENYVGLLTNRTNSFFEPYVETIYLDSITDDRQNFVLGRLNRLYLYANIGGDLVNLDQLPTCSVGDTEYEVKQAGKGIYYIEIKLPVNAYSAPTMLYDTWDNIIYNGEQLSPVEMDFTTRPAASFFQIGNQLPDKAAFTPTTYGINDNEQIKAGDLRKLCFLFKKDYTKNTAVLIDDVQVRLYVMDGTAEVNVTPYLKTNRAFNDTYIMIDTSMLVPNTYYVDVKVQHGMEMIEHHNVLHFTIVNEENNRYA